MRAVLEGALRQGRFFCPIDSKCGGCEWLAVPYAEQLKRKQHEVEGLFDGLLDSETAVRPILGMDDPRYYRNKVVSPYVGILGQKSTPNACFVRHVRTRNAPRDRF